MCLRLVCGDFEYQLALPFEAHVEERLCIMMGLSDPTRNAERVRNDLARRIVDLITAMLEGEILPPTDKQLKYAVAIARELGIELPADILQYRDAMKVFLGTHAPQYRQSKGYDSARNARP